jgi:N-acetylglucosamine-6-phosphate deacetylase
MCTHLFNAMPPFHPREPGIVGVLGSTARPMTYFGLIADGVHVHPASLKLAATARPDSVVLVSDAMMAMGLPEGTYNFGDVGRVTLAGDKAYREGTQTLAGAVVPLDECMRRFRTFCGCGSVRAIEAASLHAARVLGIESSKGSLSVGADADLILLDDNLDVCATYVGGAKAWARASGDAASGGAAVRPAKAATPPEARKGGNADGKNGSGARNAVAGAGQARKRSKQR